ncbi:DEP domain-containing protein DDB_G0279099 [Musca domestica]|uniref:DEP domain-containing protein DDB_G0279099 n=1 Tax=Musca domestica TaxID=7370 RepID=A0A1I8MD42_MUSDO|nr:DEP domain-containing protein DDB_G0279099 [Musca domestica]XP_005186774.1 DEP domain-containing protein DDB_G0279099 [Musca domestica]XP_005186776.1 DEP domain-containing protein DDB_G0279099 [Musca domestica]XP_005186777.1 DEP domain-containing protein DDB_G0279099 [Musca domestica]XP_058978613.1 DEP domain-containing protein DDB_G0279099 [Musca domestica]
MTTTTSVPAASSNNSSSNNNNTTATKATTTVTADNNNSSSTTTNVSNTTNTVVSTTNTDSKINSNNNNTTKETNCSMPQSTTIAATTSSSSASTVTVTTPTTTNEITVTTPPNVVLQRAVTITPIMNHPAPSLTPGNFTRTMQTDEDFNIRFVNLVRNHKCLYDKKVPEYRNRDNQEKAWYQISLETKESVIHCKERWRNLRACLSRYIKQQSGNDPQHKPYYLTEHMAFLLPFLKSTRNSLDGNSSLATLYQYSQQQHQLQQQQQQNNSISTTLQVMVPPQQLNYKDHGLEVKHSLSDNEDEETIDAFDPAIAANMHMQQHPNSPPLSDTASANTMQNFIPDVQLSELRTPDGAVQDYVNTNIRRDSHHDFLHEPKRIKTECHASEATTTAQLHMYAGEQADMEFFRSILPDIAALTPHQKRKLKIGILELIDDVVERYPLERSTNNANHTSNNNVTSQTTPNASSKTRRNSSRGDWHK